MNQIESKGIEKVDARCFANILHAVAKLQLSNKAYSLRMIAELESKDKVQVLFGASKLIITKN